MTGAGQAGTPRDRGAPFWLESPASLVSALGSHPGGLTTPEAAARLAETGPNDLAPPERLAALREILRDLANPLVLILLVACSIAAAFGQVVSSVVIALMLVLSVALNFSQVYRSRLAVRRLRASVAPKTTVMRDGGVREVPAREIVPGDVIRLAAGDLVPADGRLLSAKDLFLNEATLTGESLPREKHADGVPSAPGLAEATTAVFRGTSVVSGVGVALVVRTGRSTELGQVSSLLRVRPPETEFERGTRRFGLLILQLIVALVLFVFLVNALFHRDLLESFLFALALAVGLTPELLPMIVSVTLSSGAVQMARRKVVVKRLAAIENFGSMDVLCSDKTGTLTVGEITLSRHVDIRGQESEEVIHLAALNSAFQTGLRGPVDEAILRHPHPAVGRARPIDEVPFDFSRRRVSVVIEDENRRRLITKGAPEGILPLCTRVEAGGAVAPLDPGLRDAAEALFRSLSADGYRALAVAEREVPVQAAYGTRDEADLTLVGFAAFLDPPRDDVAVTIAALGADGVEVKILTGDNPLVARRICGEVGLAVDSLLLGDDVDRMTDEALAAVAERTTVFARVAPHQKSRIIRALQARGHVVGAMGDGINDAPALHAADVGISVDNAVDVAKDAADIILLERGLDVLHQGVVEGRKSFGNIMKYVLMGTSSNFGNMVSMAAASLVLPFLPLLPLQILLNNLLYDLAQLPIPSDRVDQTFTRKPRRWNVAFIRRYLLVLGPISSAFDFATFAVLLWGFQADERLFRTGWFVESLATQTLVIFVIRTAGRPWSSRPSPALAWGASAAVVAGLVLPYTPAAPWLGFVPLPASVLAAFLVLVPAYLALVEAVKRRVYREWAL